MVRQVVIHFEGSDKLRVGFGKLFENHRERARRNGIRFKTIAGGPNAETVKGFLRSCRLNPSDLNVLLIDSERPAPNAAEAIRALRSSSYWDASVAPKEDERINFMVQAMEAWFIADRQAMASHFGNGFRCGSLPNPQNAESTSPNGLTESIDQALRAIGGRRRKKYDKVRDGARLLALIDEATVRQNCPSFRRLTDFLSRGF